MEQMAGYRTNGMETNFDRYCHRDQNHRYAVELVRDWEQRKTELKRRVERRLGRVHRKKGYGSAWVSILSRPSVRADDTLFDFLPPRRWMNHIWRGSEFVGHVPYHEGEVTSCVIRFIRLRTGRIVPRVGWLRV